MTFTRLLRFSARCLPFALLAASLPSCGSSNPAKVQGTPITDANNYVATTHQLTIPTITAKAGSDLTLDWSGLMKDLLCHPLKPILNVTVAQVPLRNKTQAQLEDELAVGSFNPLNETTEHWILDVSATTTTTMISALLNGKTPFNPSTDFVPMDKVALLVAFADTIELNRGVESMAFLQPDASSSATTVMAPDACAGMFLNFAATLGTPVTVPNKSPYVLDWSGVTKDAFGNPITFATIDKIEIGYYQGKTAADLQAKFEDVELDATTLYSATDVNGATNYDLSGAKTSSGEAFSGFTQTDGVYAVALLFTGGPVPAPVIFAILQPM